MEWCRVEGNILYTRGGGWKGRGPAGTAGTVTRTVWNGRQSRLYSVDEDQSVTFFILSHHMIISEIGVRWIASFNFDGSTGCPFAPHRWTTAQHTWPRGQRDSRGHLRPVGSVDRDAGKRTKLSMIPIPSSLFFSPSLILEINNYRYLPHPLFPFRYTFSLSAMRTLLPSLLRLPLRPLCTSSPPASTPTPTPTPATPLQHELHRRIRFHGPITVAEYMRHCLLHPIHGYYTTSPHIFGPSGDFVTSPHISPIFPELLAVFLAHNIHTSASTTAPYTLVELGPGTGALLAAALPVLRRLRAAPERVTLVERSPTLQQKQRRALVSEGNPPVSWANSLDEALAETHPTHRRVFLAHEFLDALPVHVFQRLDLQHPWRERLVDVDPAAAPHDPRLRFVLATSPTPATGLLDVFRPPAHATVAEVGAEAAGVAERVANAVRESDGLGLIVDYGEDGAAADSVRAFKGHAQVDVLTEPGRVDVTADVDFAQLRAAVERVGDGVRLRGPVTQREFLLRLGAAARFRKVAQGVVERGRRERESDDIVDSKLERLQADYDRLVGEQHMGERYKVAVVARDGDGELAGGF